MLERFGVLKIDDFRVQCSDLSVKAICFVGWDIMVKARNIAKDTYSACEEPVFCSSVEELSRIFPFADILREELIRGFRFPANPANFTTNVDPVNFSTIFLLLYDERIKGMKSVIEILGKSINKFRKNLAVADIQFENVSYLAEKWKRIIH